MFCFATFFSLFRSLLLVRGAHRAINRIRSLSSHSNFSALHFRILFEFVFVYAASRTVQQKTRHCCYSRCHYCANSGTIFSILYSFSQFFILFQYQDSSHTSDGDKVEEAEADGEIEPTQVAQKNFIIPNVFLFFLLPGGFTRDVFV